MADNTFKKVGNVLLGLSSGLQGRGAEFVQQLETSQRQRQEQQRKAEVERRKTVFTDSASALNFAKQGRWDLVLKLGENRLETSSQFPGADFSDTEQLVEMAGFAAQGNTEAQQNLIQSLQNNVDIGQGMGILKSAAPKQQIVNGQLVTIGPGGAVATDIAGLRGTAADSPQIQSSDILSDGTVIKVFKSGITEVSDPQGNLITGQERADKIRDARQFGADVQGQRARERTLGSEIAKTSINVGSDAFKKIPVISKNIGNLDRVISAIDRGASTGTIQKLLPSVRSASIELDNLRNELGLDVIGDVTFGALSKGELDLALDTALPTGLSPPELKVWVENKKSAQEKVLRELRKTAKFFSLGGTITEFLELQDRRGQAAPEAPAQTAAPNQAATGGSIQFLGFE